MTTGITIIGTSVLALILAGYLAQRYKLPPPPLKIAGIDLGTTFSSIGMYQVATGYTNILSDQYEKKSVPSVVGFLKDGNIVVGTLAVEQQEINSKNTIYDAKRFIGKKFVNSDPTFQSDVNRYPFTIKLDKNGFAYFEVEQQNKTRVVTPEEVGSLIIKHLVELAEKKYEIKLKEIVISVPAEFDDLQRNYTEKASQLAGIGVRRIITEPTAAALAYGLHKKKGVEYITIVDFGGGTLDISVLWVNGGVFITQAMAGNNHLGGQDFNNNIFKMLLEIIRKQKNKIITNANDLQQLRLAIEKAKIDLSVLRETWINIKFQSNNETFKYLLTRNEFEQINSNLFDNFMDPIKVALAECQIKPENVDEIVLVGGSTRITKVRNIVGSYFGKTSNYGVDPELAVVTGVSIQAGILAGGWPLQVAAIELPTKKKKIHTFK